MPHPEIILFFFIIAFVYASVGFGGGSSYLAVLAVYSFPFQFIRMVALLCNVIVVAGGTIIFIRDRQVNWKKIIPLVVVSVPMAFLGARMKISENTFFVLLGCSLLCAGVLLWITTKKGKDHERMQRSPHLLRDGSIGGCIGFLSGLVGIGGGIFLSPLLNLMGWDSPKKIAATASLFIFVNSLSGIAGQVFSLNTSENFKWIGILCLSALAGGQLGSRMGSVKFNQLVIRRITAVLVFLAGTEVLIKHLPF